MDMQNIDKLNVLIVEDHAFQLEYLANCLAQIGITEVHKASNGRVALDIVYPDASSESVIDLVICDLQMPEMDGIEFLRHLSENSFSGAIIILTAMEASLVASVTKMVGEYDLNFIGSLLKPIDTTRLINYIVESCNEKEVGSINKPLPQGVCEADLIDALDRHSLVTYFQPLYRFENEEIVGIEALARLQLADGQLIYPDDFIYLYKKLGRTQEFELITYSHAFAFLSEMIQRGRPLRLNINFCANKLGDNAFYDAVLDLARTYSIPNDLLTVEVTERSLINDLPKSIEFLARLRLNGVNLAIDDFGTGYSSMKQLELMPFNTIKIDKSFLYDIDTDTQKQAIVQTITDLAKRLNLNTVAEGVESKAAWDIAKEFGCDICQGYYKSKALPIEAIRQILFKKT